MIKVFHKFFVILLSLFALQAEAQINITGEYVGPVKGFILGAPPQPVENNLRLRITKQNGTNFIGEFILTPSNLSTTFTGTFVSEKQINVVCNGSSSVAAGPCFAAFTDGARIKIPGFGQPGSMVITSTAGNTAEVGGELIRKKLVLTNKTAGTNIKDAGTIKSEILGVVAPIQQHIVKTLRTDTRGFNLNKLGFLLEGESGISAGETQIGNIGAWVSYNFSDIENDFSSTAYQSNSHTAILGIDFSPNDSLVVGLALAYEYSDTDTSFNGGELESQGITVAPYLGILFDEHWSLDASFGLSYIDNDQFRTDPDTQQRIHSDPSSDRFFAAFNFNGVSYIDNWVLGGRLGYLFGKNITEEFTESDSTIVGEARSKVGQIRVGTDIAYSFTNWEPFLSATYQYDSQFDKITTLEGPQPANDRDDLLIGTGFRYFNKYGLSANFIYNKRLFREDFDEDSLSLAIRYDF